MNSLELFVYNILKKQPRIKLLVRDCYQSVFDLIPIRRIESAYPVTVREGYFFGFHDHTPFSADNRMLIGCTHDPGMPFRMPLPKDLLTIGYFSGENFLDWQPLTKSRAWNWHQGCKAQWLGTQRAIVYNDHENGCNIAKIVSVDGGSPRYLPRAISSVSRDGRYGVSYNFERLNLYMPGYGYSYSTGDKQLESMRPKLDGMYLVDMETGEEKFLFSIADIADMIDNEPTMNSGYHFFSHAIFSPSGKRFVFLHRWIHNDVRKRWSRIITSDIDGENINIFPNKEMASHIAWRNNDEFVVYCRTPQGDDTYVIFDDRRPDQFHCIADGVFNSDGHPFFDPTGNFFVTDTYPDRCRRQGLYIFDFNLNVRHEIAILKTYKRFASLTPQKHWACDLHPRMDRIGRYLCFDATYTGKRGLCTIDLGQPIGTLPKIKSLNNSESHK